MKDMRKTPTDSVSQCADTYGWSALTASRLLWAKLRGGQSVSVTLFTIRNTLHCHKVVPPISPCTELAAPWHLQWKVTSHALCACRSPAPCLAAVLAAQSRYVNLLFLANGGNQMPLNVSNGLLKW